MLRLFQSKRRKEPETPKDSGRLPLRWGLIILASSVTGFAVAPVAGLPLAIGTAVAVAVALDQFLQAR
jgi:hypothetical protein